MARTTVIAGTATAVSGAVSRKQQGKYAAQQQQQQAQQAAAAQAAAPPPAPVEDPMEKLKKLGALHAQGILTDEEFAAEKAKVLNA
jgi:membrane protease subunit (stomatin/prohibitin family)